MATKADLDSSFTALNSKLDVLAIGRFEESLKSLHGKADATALAVSSIKTDNTAFKKNLLTANNASQTNMQATLAIFAVVFTIVTLSGLVGLFLEALVLIDKLYKLRS